ncbi:MAG TPA: SO_0444 family Cu/Zn efflux transporter [Candidatus Krumholzibacteria bacterium]|nr:SO_0444 family Cu/Zn efflux transporter [Candidatus Krumholzibacteria bacterium]
MTDFFSSILAILNESAPYLLLGFALAGMLHVALARFPGITARLTRPGGRSVLFGALIGVPMPLCSCSVLPAAMALRRDGAGRGATASFLVSVPETDVVSILLTLALVGPVMAIYRPIAAIVAALSTGFAVERSGRREDAAQTAAQAAAPQATDACHCPPQHAVDARPTPWWRRALRYGFVEIFDDIVVQLLIGIALAALIGSWLPAIDVKSVGSSPVLQYLVMAAIGVPLYVCATASTPIAAGFIAGGISPGAAMVFLLAGPATNIASLVVLRAELGLRFLVTYLVSIIATSILLGAAFDLITASLSLPPVTAVLHTPEAASPWRLAATGVFLVCTVVSLIRTRALQRLIGRFSARTGRPPHHGGA